MSRPLTTVLPNKDLHTRYADAEVDCTEAIALDDRYTKAYSRRGTARKELQKYFIAVEGETSWFENHQ